MSALTKDDLREAMIEFERRTELIIKGAVGILDVRIENIDTNLCALKDHVATQNGRVGKCEQALAAVTVRLKSLAYEVHGRPRRRAEDPGPKPESETVTVSIGGALVRSIFSPKLLGWLAAAAMFIWELIQRAG